MADNQVNLFVILARKIIPKTRNCVPQQQKASRKEDFIWSQVFQECWTWFQNS